MTRFFSEIARLAASDGPFALATVVEAQGSTPQPAGAKAIFLPDGTVLGTLGGGCLEAEIRRRALNVLTTGESVTFAAALDSDFGWDDGLICGGTATAFIEASPRSVVWPVLANTLGGDAWLVTVVEASDPSRRGARGVWMDGAWRAADRGIAGFVTHDPSAHATARLVTMPDGDRVAIEPLPRPPRLLICGAGHVGQATARLAAGAGFDVVVVDDRPDWANAARFPDAQVVVDDPAAFAAGQPLDERTYVVIVTRGHRNDAHVLRAVLGRSAAYIGMIGSRRKVRVLVDGFLDEGLASPEALARVRSPIGLDLGAVSVEEIAVSIVAELIAVRRGRGTGAPLSETARAVGAVAAGGTP